MKSTLLFLVVFCSLHSFSQERQLRLGKEAIDKGNFPKALEKIDYYEKKEGIKPESIFLRSLYLINTGVTIAQLDSAYLLMENAKSGINILDPKKQTEWCKDIGFCQTAFDALFFTLDKKLFDVYTKGEKLSEIETYMNRYPISTKLADAVIVRNKLAFNGVKVKNEEYSYESFIAHYPMAEQVEEAKKMMVALGYKKATAVNTFEGYLAFLNKYPQAIEAKEVQQKLWGMAWLQTLKEDSKEAYQNYLTLYPTSTYASIAQEKLEALDWQNAVAQNTIEALQLFNDAHPNSIHLEESKGKILDIKSVLLPYLTANRKYKLYNVAEKTFISDEEYETVDILENGFFRVSKFGKYGILSKRGEKILPITYDRVGNTKDVLLISLADKYGFCSFKGEQIVGLVYDLISEAENGTIVVYKQKEVQKEVYSYYVGLINANGKPLLDCKFEYITPINDSFFIVKANELSYVVDITGRAVSSKYGSVGTNLGNHVCIVSAQNKYGLLNNRGALILPVNNKSIDYCLEDSTLLAVTAADNRKYVVDDSGKIVLPLGNYQEVKILGSHRIAVGFNGNKAAGTTKMQYKLYNTLTKSYLIHEPFDEVDDGIREGLLMVVKNGKRGYCNEMGMMMVATIYSNDLKEDGSGHDDNCDVDLDARNGGGEEFPPTIASKCIEECIYNHFPYRFCNGFAAVQVNDKIGYINTKGEIVVPIIYSKNSANGFVNGLTTVSLTDDNSEELIIDTAGNVVARNNRLMSFFNDGQSALLYSGEGYSFFNVATKEISPIGSDFTSINIYNNYYKATYKEVQLYITNSGESLIDKNVDFSAFEAAAIRQEGNALLNEKKYDAAIAKLKEADNMDPNNYETLSAIARCYAGQNYASMAITYYDKCIAIDASNTAAYYAKMDINKERKYWSDAVEDINKLIALTTYRDSNLYFQKGYCEMEQGYYQNAINDFTISLSINVSWAMSYNNRGVCYNRLSLYSQAIADYTAAIKHSSNDSNEDKGLYYCNRGSNLWNLGRKTEACLDYRKAASFGNSNAINQLRYCK